MTIERAAGPGAGEDALLDDDAALLDELTQPVPVEPTEADEAAARPPDRSSRAVRRPALRARQVERVIRRVRLWSVLRVAAVSYLCLWLVVTVAAVIVWRVAVAAGAIDNLESFIAQLLAEDSFTIDGGSMLGASAVMGLILVVAGTATTVLLALLFNLVSDLTGGVRIAVVELETIEPDIGEPDEPSDELSDEDEYDAKLASVRQMLSKRR